MFNATSILTNRSSTRYLNNDDSMTTTNSNLEHDRLGQRLVRPLRSMNGVPELA